MDIRDLNYHEPSSMSKQDEQEYIHLSFSLEPTDPCKDIICPTDQTCQLDDDRRPSCSCNQKCSFNKDNNNTTVCASDGQIYSNECYMQRESCLSGFKLRTMERSYCTKGEIQTLYFALLNTIFGTISTSNENEEERIEIASGNKYHVRFKSLMMIVNKSP